MKEHEIRPPDLFERYLELSRQDAEVFFSDPTEFESLPCPGCGGEQVEHAFTKAGFHYVECVGCGSLFVSPRPSREALGAFYADSLSATYWAESFPPTVVEARREKVFVPRVEYIAALCNRRSFQPRCVIDVGAGYGIFLEEVKKRFPSATVRAVEPGRKLAEVCRRRGLETMEAPVEEAAAWNGTADLVTCFEVIEHVHTPADFIRAMFALAKPGGYVLVTALGVEGFDIQVLWERSKSVAPPHHLNFLSVAGFERLFSRLGFVEIEVMTPGKLDLDIVRNEWFADPSVLNGDRFVRLLLRKRDPAVHEEFQKFLAKNHLSSHVRVLGRKPVESV